MSGSIFPGRDGRVYVTPTDTTMPTWRRHALRSHVHRPAFEVPDERLHNVSEVQEVEPHNEQPGGGLEQYVTHPVEASDLVWQEVRR